MSNFCCRSFVCSELTDFAGLYGGICAAVPSCYVCGRGFSNDCLRFGLENGAKVELRFKDGICEIWLLDCPPAQAQEAAAVYGVLFEELVERLEKYRQG